MADSRREGGAADDYTVISDEIRTDGPTWSMRQGFEAYVRRLAAG